MHWFSQPAPQKCPRLAAGAAGAFLSDFFLFMTEWNIQSRGRICSACGKNFADKETYHTLLYDDKAEFSRLDICQACWTAQYQEGARERKGFISYWHGVYEAPPPPTDPIQKETAESLLRKLIELNDPRYAAAGYILAVMLERKRLLKVKEQLVKDGRRLFIYEQPGTGDVFTIADPNLQLDQLEQVQHDVADLLTKGLPAEAGASVAPAPAPVAPVAPPAGAAPGEPAAAADAAEPSGS